MGADTVQGEVVKVECKVVEVFGAVAAKVGCAAAVVEVSLGAKMLHAVEVEVVVTATVICVVLA